MHEMSLCESVVELVQEQAHLQGFCQVQRICLEIGELSCVSEEALCFAFDAVAKGTLAEAALLCVDTVAGVGWCSACQCEVGMQQRYDACPECGYYPLVIRAGEEMRIKALEVV